jgi:hypothetical protein
MSLHHAFVFAAVALFTASCVSTYRAPQTPTLKSRQSGEWHRTANRIQSDQYTIFYHGTAQREPPSKRIAGLEPFAGIYSLLAAKATF